MKILNIGSLNIDHVYSLDHIVVSGETVSASNLEYYCGGKGFNQSVALHRAGADVRHMGKVGADGTMLLEAMRDYGMDTSGVRVDAALPTGHAVIQVDRNGRNSIIVYGGANTALTEAEIDAALSDFGAGDLLLMQNEVNGMEYAFRRAKERGMRTALNPSPMGMLASSPVLALTDLFILNEIEGEQITGETEPEHICDALLRRFPGTCVMLTLGADGCMYAEGTRIVRQAAEKVTPVDTTAAGDTFLGYFLAGLACGDEIPAVLIRATKAAAIAVTRPGAAPSIPYREELD